MRCFYLKFSLLCVALVSLLFSPMLLADVQINQSAANGQFMHAPYDPNNTDNELYIGSVTPNANVQLGGTQSATLVSVVKIAKEYVPNELRLGKREVYRLTNADTDGEQCTLTDVNGDARQTDNWEVTFRKVIDRKDRLYDYQDGFVSFRVSVLCSDS